MKLLIKNLTLSLIISFCCLILNLFTDRFLGIMIPAILAGGGEINIFIGFGLIRETHYPLSSLDHPISVTSKLSFSPLIFLAGFLLMFLLICIIKHVISRHKRL